MSGVLRIISSINSFTWFSLYLSISKLLNTNTNKFGFSLSKSPLGYSFSASWVSTTKVSEGELLLQSLSIYHRLFLLLRLAYGWDNYNSLWSSVREETLLNLLILSLTDCLLLLLLLSIESGYLKPISYIKSISIGSPSLYCWLLTDADNADVKSLIVNHTIRISLWEGVVIVSSFCSSNRFVAWTNSWF